MFEEFVEWVGFVVVVGVEWEWRVSKGFGDGKCVANGRVMMWVGLLVAMVTVGGGGGGGGSFGVGVVVGTMIVSSLCGGVEGGG